MSDRDDQGPLAPKTAIPCVLDRIASMRSQEKTYRYRDVFASDPDWSDPPGDEDMQESDQALEPGPGPAIRAAASPPPKPIDAACRVKMAEWCTQVIDFCGFSRETVGIGLCYLDRYVASGNKRARRAMGNRKEYQLAAMTGLYMAIKLHEPLEMELKHVAEISRGCYSSADIASMELEMLQALDWRLTAPTPLAFVEHLLAIGVNEVEAASPSSAVAEAVRDALLDFSRFQTELVNGLPALMSEMPSRIAVAVLLNSLDAIDSTVFLPGQRTALLSAVGYASGVDPGSADLRPVRDLLMESFVKNAGVDFGEVAARIRSCEQGGKRVGGTQATESSSSSPSSSGAGADLSARISPVCIGDPSGMKKQKRS